MDFREHERAILDCGTFDRQWLADHGWCAVPVAGKLDRSSPLVTGLLRTLRAAKADTIYRRQVELELPKLDAVAATEAEIGEFLGMPHFGDALLAPDLLFIILRPPEEFFIIAGTIDIVENILGCTIWEAFDAFRRFAEDPENWFYDTPGFRFYLFAYEYYRATLPGAAMEKDKGL